MAEKKQKKPKSKKTNQRTSKTPKSKKAPKKLSPPPTVVQPSQNLNMHVYSSKGYNYRDLISTGKRYNWKKVQSVYTNVLSTGDGNLLL